MVYAFSQDILMDACYNSITFLKILVSVNNMSSSILYCIVHIYYIKIPVIDNIFPLKLSKPLTSTYIAQLNNNLKSSNSFIEFHLSISMKLKDKWKQWKQTVRSLQWLLLKLLPTDFVSYSWKLAGMQIKLYHTCQTASQLCNQLALQIKNKTCY